MPIFIQMQTVPVSGTSVGLMILRICSIDCKSGDSPEVKMQNMSLDQSYHKYLNNFSSSDSEGLHFGTRRGNMDGNFLTSMAAKDLLIDDSSDGEAVEAVSESLP